MADKLKRFIVTTGNCWSFATLAEAMASAEKMCHAASLKSDHRHVYVVADSHAVIYGEASAKIEIEQTPK